MYGIEDKIIKWLKGKKADSVTVKKSSNEEKSNEGVQTEQKSTQTENAKKQKITYNQLIDNLKEYNQRLDEMSPSEESLKPPESLTDSQIKNKVTLELDDKYKGDYDALKDKVTKTEKDVVKQNENAIEEWNKKQLATVENYNKSVEDAKNNAIKKGVSRSSIVTSALGKIDEHYRQNINEIKNNLQKELKNNEDKMKQAQDSYKEAINNLDVKKAVELKERVENFKKQQEKMLEDYYKNSANIGAHNPIGPDGEINQEMIDIYGKIIQDTLNYYTSMTGKEARESFKNDYKIKELLGDYQKTIEMYLNSFN